MERRHLLRGRLPGGGLHPENTTTELTPAEKSAEVGRWSRDRDRIEREIARANKRGAGPSEMASLYAQAAHICTMLSYAMAGFRYDPNAARRNAERRLILDALG